MNFLCFVHRSNLRYFNFIVFPYKKCQNSSFIIKNHFYQTLTAPNKSRYYLESCMIEIASSNPLLIK